MDSEALTEYLNERLGEIQSRRNFKQSLGAKQVKDFPEAQADYARFTELLRLARKFRIPIALVESAKAETEKHVYFCRAMGTQLWKIGFSINPHKRGKGLQTGNHANLTVLGHVPGDRDLEQLILRHTEKYRSKHGGTEWRVLPKWAVKDLIRKIKTLGPDYLKGPCADYSRPDENDDEDPKEEALEGTKNVQSTD